MIIDLSIDPQRDFILIALDHAVCSMPLFCELRHAFHRPLIGIVAGGESIR